MNRNRVYLYLDLGPTDKPAGEDNEQAELSKYMDAIRSAVATIPGASILSALPEIVGPVEQQAQVRFNELAL